MTAADQIACQLDGACPPWLPLAAFAVLLLIVVCVYLLIR